MKKITLLLSLILIVFSARAQDTKKYRIVCLGFYNVENLYDTEHDEGKNDYEFLPNGANNWTEDRYQKKLENIAEVISKLGTRTVPSGVAVLGLCEIENLRVLDDLVAMPSIKDKDYQIVHYEGPDLRGVDVALIYQPSMFTVESSRAIPLKISGNDNFFTRDQLLVSGILDGELVHIIVNHWPSRSGGEKRSSPLRRAAAELARSVVDSILQIDENAKIIVITNYNMY